MKKNITNKVKSSILFKHKWIMLFVFLIFMALSASTIHYVRTVDRVSPNLFELILEQTNEPEMILFPMMYILLLFSINEKVGKANNSMPFELLKHSVIAAVVYMLVFIAANLLYSLIVLNIDSIFNNTWSYTSSLSATELSPLSVTAGSVILLFMRYCFIIYLISFINTLTQKSHWGFWCAFIITYIDYMLYRLLLIPYPLGILPLENTRITYTQAYVPDFENIGVRIPYFCSVLYWVGLIAVVYIGLLLIYRKRSKYENSVH